MLSYRQNIHNSRGFTLVELMIVVAIFGILAGFGVPSYKAWIENSKVRNAATSMLNGIQKARNLAVQNNTQMEFRIGTNTDWLICATTTCPTAIESRTTADGSSASVTVANTGGTTVVFNNLGTRLSGFTRLDFSTGALSSSDRRDLAIVVKTGGSAKLCDPAFDVSNPVMGCV